MPGCRIKPTPFTLPTSEGELTRQDNLNPPKKPNIFLYLIPLLLMPPAITIAEISGLYDWYAWFITTEIGMALLLVLISYFGFSLANKRDSAAIGVSTAMSVIITFCVLVVTALLCPDQATYIRNGYTYPVPTAGFSWRAGANLTLSESDWTYHVPDPVVADGPMELVGKMCSLSLKNILSGDGKPNTSAPTITLKDTGILRGGDYAGNHVISVAVSDNSYGVPFCGATKLIMDGIVLSKLAFEAAHHGSLEVMQRDAIQAEREHQRERDEALLKMQRELGQVK
jgi:hypothetical protein